MQAAEAATAAATDVSMTAGPLESPAGPTPPESAAAQEAQTLSENPTDILVVGKAELGPNGTDITASDQQAETRGDTDVHMQT